MLFGMYVHVYVHFLYTSEHKPPPRFQHQKPVAQLRTSDLVWVSGSGEFWGTLKPFAKHKLCPSPAQIRNDELSGAEAVEDFSMLGGLALGFKGLAFISLGRCGKSKVVEAALVLRVWLC